MFLYFVFTWLLFYTHCLLSTKSYTPPQPLTLFPTPHIGIPLHTHIHTRTHTHAHFKLDRRSVCALRRGFACQAINLNYDICTFCCCCRCFSCGNTFVLLAFLSPSLFLSRKWKFIPDVMTTPLAHYGVLAMTPSKSRRV